MKDDEDEYLRDTAVPFSWDGVRDTIAPVAIQQYGFPQRMNETGAYVQDGAVLRDYALTIEPPLAILWSKTITPKLPEDWIPEGAFQLTDVIAMLMERDWLQVSQNWKTEALPHCAGCEITRKLVAKKLGAKHVY